MNQRRAADETKAVLPTLKQKIKDALAKLEELIVSDIKSAHCRL